MDNITVRAESLMADLEEIFTTLRKYDLKFNSGKCIFGIKSRQFLGYLIFERGIEANLDKV